MKNREKYHDELMEVLCSSLAVHKDKMTFGLCDEMDYDCENCLFNYSVLPCVAAKEHWLEEEYQEPIVLSEDEKAVLRNIDKKYKWIARDSDTLSVYEIIPYKDSLRWRCGGAFRKIEVFSHLFQFIKPLDKAYKIDELLGIGGAEGTE